MSRLAEARAVLTRALAIDRGRFQPLLALRSAVGVTIPMAVGVATGHPIEGSIAAAGALPAGIAGMGGGFASGGPLIAATAAGMTVSTFVGGLVAGHLGPTLAVLLVWGLLAGIIVVLGREATIVGTQAVVGLVVFGRFPSSVASSAVHAGWVLAGGALQALLAAVVRPARRLANERHAVAASLVELARLAHDIRRSSLPAATAVQTAADLVNARPATGETEVLRGLTDELDRIRMELSALAGFPDEPGVRDVTVAAAAWLRRLGQAVAAGRPPPDESPELGAAVEAMRRRRDSAAVGPGGTGRRFVAARSVALLGQLRATDRLAATAAGARQLTLTTLLGGTAVLAMPSRFRSNVQRVLAVAHDPASPPFRHAVRLGVVLVVAEWLSHALPGQRGYWVSLTALVVLKPDYAATVQRGIARVVGTGLGVVLAGLIVVGVHPSGTAVTALVASFAWAAYTGFAASYALYSFTITGLVVLLLSATGGNDLSTVADRGIDTAVGGALALLAYLVWPTWERDSLDESIGEVYAALARYCDLVLAGYVAGQPVDRSSGQLASRARVARVAAESSLERTRAEPSRVRGDVDRAASLLAAASRIVRTIHALRTVLADTDEHVPLPVVAGIRHTITAALRAIAEGVRPEVGDLREQQQQLLEQATVRPHTLPARRLAVLAAHLDPLVDSIDTAAYVVD